MIILPKSTARFKHNLQISIGGYEYLKVQTASTVNHFDMCRLEYPVPLFQQGERDGANVHNLLSRNIQRLKS